MQGLCVLFLLIHELDQIKLGIFGTELKLKTSSIGATI